jgi:hypothetical protein
VFDALTKSILQSGYRIVTADEDVAVIWSILWRGRMKPNQLVYQQAKLSKKPVIIIEVGNLLRGKTWRLSLMHINRDGEFANQDNLDARRPEKLQIELHPLRKVRNPKILLTTQHDQSLQWQGQPKILDWVDRQIKEIRKYTDRHILIRPHPRCPINFRLSSADISINYPCKVNNTYDDYDIDYNHHCVINHNSGPTVQAAIAGTPVICDSSGLAYEVSDKIENIEKIQLFDRQEWFLKLCHTEWTIEEIADGMPLQRLITKINLDR